jgi:hypothetical protein
MPAQKIKPYLKLLRHLLGSIDLSDIDKEEYEEKQETEAERRNYCGAIYAVFPILEKDIKRMLYKQLLFANNNSENWDQVLFSRGTFNGMSLLLEQWKQASTEHKIPNDDNKEEIIKDI